MGKSLLNEYDVVKCSSQEDKILIINIALKLGIAVHKDTIYYQKINLDYPWLEVRDNYIKDKKASINESNKYYTPLQFVAKMVGYNIDRVNKIKELEGKVSELLDEINKLKDS